MEAVRAFNNELSSLYECKPPVSRAKMAHVTKCAIKAIKFYKHVVQSVEKFIQKCKPEYKVPGLYVIDSVVRQSRHQFGSQKDVFAPRFTKNIIATFQNLFKCPGDERSKIVRVLNLWQKNEVFPSEIIQPLLDLAADPTKPSLIAAAQAAVDGVLADSGKSSSSQSHPGKQQHHQSAPEQGKKAAQDEGQLSQSAAESMLATQNDMLNTVTQLLQQTDSGNKSLSAQQQQLQQLQLLQQQLIQQTQLMQQPTGTAPIIDGNLLAQIQALTNQLLSKTELKPDGERFNKKLLDFDYGESDDEDGAGRHQGDPSMAGNVQTILNDSSLMQQIHQVSQTIQSNEQLQSEISEQEKRRRILEQQQAEFDQQISQVHKPPQPPFGGPPPVPDQSYREEGEYEEEQLMDEDFRDHQQMRDRDDRDRRDRRRRSRDRSRTPKRRRRSRSRSRDRRRRSRSRDRHRRSRSKDREREKQKEKERDRQKKALPPLKENCVGVCTTTIWIGHLNKFTQEEELKEELERYGPVDNISMVPPRGCAYVVMSIRKDAHKAINRLRGYKLNGSALKTAWAQSTGMREADYKEGWDVENGVKYIPWDCLPADLSTFLDGAILDSDSLPTHLKDIPTEKLKAGDHSGMGDGQMNAQANAGDAQQQQMPAQSMMGMVPQPGMMPPGLPGMMPGMMMPMQRPMVPGLPPQAMGMRPGGPPQMMPGAPQLPGMPGVPVTAGMNPMSIANTSTTTIPQSLQNVAVASGALPTSPAVARPGFTPGGPPQRFGFNPNLPPPGFRLPPPGFGMRPLLPGVPNSTPDTPDKQDNPPVLKQPEMAWPPDSNEKDEEDDEANDNSDKPTESGQFKPAFGNPPIAPVPPGADQSPVRMLGPPPPGMFPHGPPGSPWSMRFGGPRQMRPMGGMPPMGGDNPDMFNSLPPFMGPRGPRFMGNRLGMPGSPGFPMPPMMRGRPPSLLDLDIKPPEKFEEKFESENFEGETFEKEENENEEVENKNSDNEEEENVKGGGGYPHNSWKNARDSRDRNHDRSHRDDDRNRDRNSRNRDRDRDRDRSDSRNRDRDRNWDRDRDDRHRDRRDSRERDRSRGDRDRDRDWRKHDDNRESRGDRKEERGERERTRKSRWSNIEDTVESVENPKAIEPETVQPVETPQIMEAIPETSETTEPTSAEVPVENNSENIVENNDANMDIGQTDMDLEIPTEAVSEHLERTENVLSEAHDNGAPEETTQAELEPVCVTNTNDSNEKEADLIQSANGPVSEEDIPNVIPTGKLDSVILGEPLLESEGKEENGENKENLELEEGEISS